MTREEMKAVAANMTTSKLLDKLVEYGRMLVIDSSKYDRTAEKFYLSLDNETDNTKKLNDTIEVIKAEIISRAGN